MLDKLEQYSLYFLIAGLALVLIAWVALVRRGFQVHWLWGMGNLFLVGIPFFLLVHFSRARGPLMLLLLAGLIIGGTYGVNYYVANFMRFGPREKIVDGERHITLTGWHKTDYSLLQDKPDTMVLQMANGDVTDQTLELIKGMTQLYELDLNDSRITDAGLKTLAELPQLRILRLRKTPITDEGFRAHLFDKESLLEVDVRETEIKSKTMREWKAQKPDRKSLP